ncbi:MAG: type II secretion system protein [Candidatus Paceibacterota bacterium]|jgi:prepilin-type N-terminal cleavage/methylation domain-containing protein
MKKYFSNNKGFTLVELMVVIAIIAILTGVIIVSVSGARGKARDGKRVSDISQIQLALEQYFDRCRVYPATLALTATHTNCPVGVTLATFIAVIPKDPVSASNYDYAVDNATTPLDYVLHTTLESPNGAIVDGLSVDLYGSKTCNPTDKDYCVGPK